MKKLIAILMAIFLIFGYAFAEGTISKSREFTVEEQAFDAYLDISYAYDESMKYLEELGVLWTKVIDASSVDDIIGQAWFNSYMMGSVSDSDLERMASLDRLAIKKYGYKGAEEFSSYLNNLRDKTDAIWICLAISQEAGYIEYLYRIESYLDDAMEDIRAVMALDREYPFLKDLQNYYKDARYAYEYVADFNDSYGSFNEKLDRFQENRRSWEIDFEFIYDKNADEFNYVYETRSEELIERKQAICSYALVLEESGNYKEAFDLYWMAYDLSEAEEGMARCHAKMMEEAMK